MNTVVETWEVPDIGPVAVAVSDRARYARITINRAGEVKLVLPRRMSLKKGREYLESARAWIRRHLKRAPVDQPERPLDRVQARTMLVERLAELARRHGFTYNRVFVKNQRTVWGSCSSANNINLNANLVRLPEELRDYVILHELVHTRHRNHSKAFWAALDQFVGDGKGLQKRLRQYQPGIAV